MRRLLSIILTVLSICIIFFINSPLASANENIANGDNYILDAPGYAINTNRGVLNTTRQRTVQQWLDEYTGKGTVWVYRVSSSYN
ncbi:hypothetical protein ACSLGG_14730 [Bacillus mycoides]|uniref:hypothetical protein n=1 Tax=Bacillus mycoides TaxID=1405 RepID=UPI003F7514C4